jgi:hypothetical protein
MLRVTRDVPGRCRAVLTIPIPDAELHILLGGHAPWFDHADHVAQHAHRFLGEHPD